MIIATPLFKANYNNITLEVEKQTWAKETAFLAPRISSCICKNQNLPLLHDQKQKLFPAPDTVQKPKCKLKLKTNVFKEIKQNPVGF